MKPGLHLQLVPFERQALFSAQELPLPQATLKLSRPHTGFASGTVATQATGVRSIGRQPRRPPYQSSLHSSPAAQATPPPQSATHASSPPSREQTLPAGHPGAHGCAQMPRRQLPPAAEQSVSGLHNASSRAAVHPVPGTQTSPRGQVWSSAQGKGASAERSFAQPSVAPSASTTTARAITAAPR